MNLYELSDLEDAMNDIKEDMVKDISEGLLNLSDKQSPDLVNEITD